MILLLSGGSWYLFELLQTLYISIVAVYSAEFEGYLNMVGAPMFNSLQSWINFYRPYRYFVILNFRKDS